MKNHYGRVQAQERLASFRDSVLHIVGKVIGYMQLLVILMLLVVP